MHIRGVQRFPKAEEFCKTLRLLPALFAVSVKDFIECGSKFGQLYTVNERRFTYN